MAKKHKGLMSTIKSKVVKEVKKEVKEDLNPTERLGHAWKGALAAGGKLDKTNAAFPMGKGSQGVELFREMMNERGRSTEGAQFNDLWDQYKSAPHDFEF
tara:strand:+ start:286 stop:585 length:300 start_codon:yes stop_codon:yes gene_type:complete